MKVTNAHSKDAARTEVVYNAVVTCEKRLFKNYSSLRRRPSEMILYQRVETCHKLFPHYFIGLLRLMNTFKHVHSR